MDLPGIDILWRARGGPTGPKVGSQPWFLAATVDVALPESFGATQPLPGMNPVPPRAS